MFNFSPEFEGREKRYAVVYNPGTDVWRILDLWHESLTSLQDLEMEIPDDSPAMTVLPGMAVVALREEMERLGWMKSSKPEAVEDVQVVSIEDKEPELEEQGDASVEKYAIDSIVKIVGTRQIKKLGR